MQDLWEAMGFIEKIVFQEYENFINDFNNFKKKATLFALESKAILMGIIETFNKEKYRNDSIENKIKYIENAFRKINKDVILNMIETCEILIKKSTKLYDDYGSVSFKLKYIVLQTLGWTALGALVGLIIGMAIPFLSWIEASMGAGVGAAIGLTISVLQVLFCWKEKQEEVKKIRDHLLEIGEHLVEIKSNIQNYYVNIRKSENTLLDLTDDKSYSEIEDLENDILKTNESVDKLIFNLNKQIKKE